MVAVKTIKGVRYRVNAIRTQYRHTCATRSCVNSDIPSSVVPVQKTMNSLS